MSLDTKTDLKVKVKALQKGYVLIILEGDMDAYTSKKFKRVLEDQIEKRKYKLIVDLEKVTWIDTVGAGALREGHEKTLSRNGKFCLIYDKSRVKKFLAVTRLQELFTVFKTKNQALRILGIG